ncbi:MAG TPA: outer membrane beta-barrel protein [Rhizomicrobium sp.]|jgi:hypothetical protein|nr:outer membrane beta-barrel protein [Rhizomicrobium sp.]
MTRPRVHARGSAFGAIALLLLGSVPGAADETAPAGSVPVGVMERPRPDYDAQGIALGDWTLFPALAALANYDDNVFRLQQQRAPDWYAETAPSLRLVRKWDGGAFSVFGNADNLAYARFDRLNLTDWSFGADGSVTLAKGLLLTGSGYYGESHEGFESAEVIGAQRDYTRYYRGHAESHLNYENGDWIVGGGATFDRFDWGSTTLLDGSRFSNGDRDESLFAPYAKAGYRFAPGYYLFARALYDGRNFDHDVRSSTGGRIDAGISFAPNKTWNGEVYLGWLHQEFKSPLPDFSTIDYGAAIDWYPSDILTVHFTASRAASDIVLPGFTVSDDQTFRLSADYEARHDVIVQGVVGYTNSHLEGPSFARTDQYPSAGVTVRYLINRYAGAEFGYVYSSRHSAPNPFEVLNFRDQIFSAGLRLHI